MTDTCTLYYDTTPARRKNTVCLVLFFCVCGLLFKELQPDDIASTLS